VHLVGFVIRIYHNAQSPEHQTPSHDLPLISTLHDLLYANIYGRKHKSSIYKQLKKYIHKTFDGAVYKHRSPTQALLQY